MCWLWISVGGLLLLWFFAPFERAAEERRVAEQRPGDAEQLTRNLEWWLIRAAVTVAIAVGLWAIGYYWTP